MVTHILSMTYGPKIEGVRNGAIRQTIRRLNPKRPFKLGDKLLIHGWSGKPYRSPWNWRMEAIVTEVFELCVADWGVVGLENPPRWTSWDDEGVDYLAESDGIDPPTGDALKAVLERFHGKFHEPAYFQVIRW